MTPSEIVRAALNHYAAECFRVVEHMRALDAPEVEVQPWIARHSDALALASEVDEHRHLGGSFVSVKVKP